MTAFLSYSTADAVIAEKIRDAIQREGGKDAVWMAPGSIPAGQDYSQWIPTAIEQCDRVILVLSHASNRSDYVRKEIDRAIARKKPVFVVHIQKFEPRGGLEYLIAGNQRIPAFEQDSAAWMRQVVTSALAPAHELVFLPPPQRGAFIKINAGLVAFAAATLATLFSLAIHGAPVEVGSASSPLLSLREWVPSPYVMLGILALMAVGAWVIRIMNAREQDFVVRSSDVIAIAGVLVGFVLITIFFLFTPLAAAAVVALAYLPLRRVFVRRWGVLAAVLVILVGVSAWWAEGTLYRQIFERGPAVAVIPICGGGECEWDREANSYKAIVGGIDEVLNGEAGLMMPSRNSVASFYDSRKDFETRNRHASLVALGAHGRTFDRLVEVTLQPGCTGAPEQGGYRITVQANRIQKRKPPVWSDWNVGEKLPIDDRLRFDGEAPREPRVAALLLSGLIIEDVIGIEPESNKALFPDDERVKVSRRFLNLAIEEKVSRYLSEPTRLAAVSAARASAPAAEVNATFKRVLAEVRALAVPDEEEPAELCRAESARAVKEVRIRNNLGEAAPKPPPPPDFAPPPEAIPAPHPPGGPND